MKKAIFLYRVFLEKREGGGGGGHREPQHQEGECAWLVDVDVKRELLSHIRRRRRSSRKKNVQRMNITWGRHHRRRLQQRKQ